MPNISKIFFLFFKINTKNNIKTQKLIYNNFFLILYKNIFQREKGLTSSNLPFSLVLNLDIFHIFSW